MKKIIAAMLVSCMVLSPAAVMADTDNISHTIKGEHISSPFIPRLSVHFLSAKIYIPWLVVAEALLLRSKKVIVEHQEIRVLADFYGAL